LRRPRSEKQEHRRVRGLARAGRDVD
jgi:hypothetical protein